MTRKISRVDEFEFRALIRSIVIEEKANWSKGIKIKKGKMHKILGLAPDVKIASKYESGKALAKALLSKTSRKDAASMLSFAANINPEKNIFDKALHALKNIK